MMERQHSVCAVCLGHLLWTVLVGFSRLSLQRTEVLVVMLLRFLWATSFVGRFGAAREAFRDAFENDSWRVFY